MRLLGKMLASLGVLGAVALAATVVSAAGAGPGFELGGAPRIEVSGPDGLLPGFGLLPGDSFTSVRTVTFHGSRPPAALGLQLAGYSARAGGSDTACTAADPGSKITVTVSQAGSVIYAGSLSQLALEHGTASQMLPLPGPWTSGHPAQVSFRVGLDHSADNAYLGCRTTAGLRWVSV